MSMSLPYMTGWPTVQGIGTVATLSRLLPGETSASQVSVQLIFLIPSLKTNCGETKAQRRSIHWFKGTVSPVLSRIKVVLLNIVESGEVPLVI
jgi:hypothetical protein